MATCPNHYRHYSPGVLETPNLGTQKVASNTLSDKAILRFFGGNIVSMKVLPHHLEGFL